MSIERASGQRLSATEYGDELQLDMSEGVIQLVTVFQERAEVCRLFSPVLTEGLLTKILLRKLSPAIDCDSIRVEIGGQAEIQDVHFEQHALMERHDAQLARISELQAKLVQERRHKEALLNKQQRLERLQNVLETLAESLTNNNSIRREGTINLGSEAVQPEDWVLPAKTTADVASMESVQQFFNLYESRAETFDEGLLACREELEQAELVIRDLESAILSLEQRNDQEVCRELIVSVEARVSGPINLLLTYIVGSASWTPCYDLRLFSTDGCLKIVYYGLVQQATGEDWQPRDLRLCSSSQPVVGGSLPEIGSQLMKFKSSLEESADTLGELSTSGRLSSKASKHRLGIQRSKSTRVSSPGQQPTLTSQDVDAQNGSSRSFSLLRSRDATLATSCATSITTAGNSGTLQSGLNGEVSLRYPQSEVGSPSVAGGTLLRRGGETSANQWREEQPSLQGRANSHTASRLPAMFGATFDIPRPPERVLCDSRQHKVTIAIVDFQPSLEYVSVPKKAPHAFIKATMVNHSKYPFFPGRANVYIDNSFVAKSFLGFVAPSEEFSCKLGADQKIKVKYNPMYKFKEVSMSSGKNVIYTFRQSIDFRNFHNCAIKLLVLEQLPSSREEKLRITLHEPAIKHPEKYDKSRTVRLNKQNIIEWDLELGPNQSKELTLKFSVEHPISEEVAFFEE